MFFFLCVCSLAVTTLQNILFILLLIQITVMHMSDRQCEVAMATACQSNLYSFYFSKLALMWTCSCDVIRHQRTLQCINIVLWG